jgi:hypothetical protein
MSHLENGKALADWFEGDGSWRRLEKPTHWLKLALANVFCLAFGLLFAVMAWWDLTRGFVKIGKISRFTRADSPVIFWAHVTFWLLLAAWFVVTALVLTTVLVGRRFGFIKQTASRGAQSTSAGQHSAKERE